MNPNSLFLGHESPNLSKSQPNLQITVSMPPQERKNPSTKNKNTTAEEKCTSTSDLKKLVLQQPDNNVTDEIEAEKEVLEVDEKSISSCSAGSNSSCGSSYCSNCPHCLIQCKKSTDIFDKNVEEVFL